jgi:O-antigen ligase
VWLPATVALLSVAALAYVMRERARLTRAQALVAGALAALAAWSALSALWSPDAHASLLEARRTLVYVAAVVAAALVGGRLLAGVPAGLAVVCAYAVGERLLHGPPDPPDPFQGTLLQEPIGYANGLAGLGGIGLAVALVLLLRDPRRRLLGGLLAPLFFVTVLLTESRGAWLGVAVGAAVGGALALGRVRVARAVGAAAAVGLGLLLALPAGSLADELADRAGDRAWYWHVAWQEAAEAPLFGRGAGSFATSWLERLPVNVAVQDAHSVYLETLAELGLVGLALLVLALGIPLAAALRGVGAAAAAGYVAFLVQAGVDWHWELPAVTVAGLLCGAAILQERERRFSVPVVSTTEHPEQGGS